MDISTLKNINTTLQEAETSNQYLTLVDGKLSMTPNQSDRSSLKNLTALTKQVLEFNPNESELDEANKLKVHIFNKYRNLVEKIENKTKCYNIFARIFANHFIKKAKKLILSESSPLPKYTPEATKQLRKAISGSKINPAELFESFKTLCTKLRRQEDGSEQDAQTSKDIHIPDYQVEDLKNYFKDFLAAVELMKSQGSTFDTEQINHIYITYLLDFEGNIGSTSDLRKETIKLYKNIYKAITNGKKTLP